jgi:hypothetical protein
MYVTTKIYVKVGLLRKFVSVLFKETITNALNKTLIYNCFVLSFVSVFFHVFFLIYASFF